MPGCPDGQDGWYVCKSYNKHKHHTADHPRQDRESCEKKGIRLVLLSKLRSFFDLVSLASLSRHDHHRRRRRRWRNKEERNHK